MAVKYIELKQAAEMLGVSTDEFRAEFESVVANDPPPPALEGLPTGNEV